MRIIENKFFYSAPGANLTAMTVVSGEAKTRLTASRITLREIMFHSLDTSVEFRIDARGFKNLSSTPPFIYNEYGRSDTRKNYLLNLKQELNSRDDIFCSFKANGGAGFNNFLGMTILYDDVETLHSLYAAPSDIEDSVRMLTVDISTAAVTNIAAWQTVANLASSKHLFKGNTFYAIAGIVSSVPDADPGNLTFFTGVKCFENNFIRQVAPRSVYSNIQDDYFLVQSQRLGVPTIPVFYSDNANMVDIDVLYSHTTEPAFKGQLIVYELSEKFKQEVNNGLR